MTSPGDSEIIRIDRSHVWHPYSGVGTELPVFPIRSAHGVRLKLDDNRELIDGMASWWCMIHGYNHPVLNAAIERQMQGHGARDVRRPDACARDGLGEEAGRDHAARPGAGVLRRLGFGVGRGRDENGDSVLAQHGAAGKTRFVSLRNGYHGDTLHAMSVCDPVTGMHTLFDSVLPQQLFVPAPRAGFDGAADPADIAALEKLLAAQSDAIAAVILEPVVQGAGGMRFYSPDYLRAARALCDRHGVLLIADEIATGFGRTGRLFACEHAGISPDILCLGKALTGGYLTMAATLATRAVGEAISNGEPGVFMHGPTFMANPLACAVSLASIELLLSTDWQAQVARIEKGLTDGLAACAPMPHVADVRVLGAIGVVELAQPVDMKTVQPMFVEQGVWVRPFGRLVYLMPPFVMTDADLATLTAALVRVVGRLVIDGERCVPAVQA